MINNKLVGWTKFVLIATVIAFLRNANMAEIRRIAPNAKMQASISI